MKRFHVHVSVDDLEQSIRFYSAVFGAAPNVIKPDYAKWMLDDPRVNFAISNRGHACGLNHLGIQAESAAELEQLHEQLDTAGSDVLAQTGTSCCYSRSDKYWTTDPAGIAWETFHSLESVPTYGKSGGESREQTDGACCIPLATLTPSKPESTDSQPNKGAASCV
jgi:catechol 2,3-dioxygenase-like lactoylglutathione lyase family enzyme